MLSNEELTSLRPVVVVTVVEVGRGCTGHRVAEALKGGLVNFQSDYESQPTGLVEGHFADSPRQVRNTS